VETSPLVALCVLAVLASLCAPAGAAHVTGVYWIQDAVYYYDLTIHNNEAQDRWPAYALGIGAAGFAAQAPEGWEVRAVGPLGVMWITYEQEHHLQPGYELSGFAFQSEQFHADIDYKVSCEGHLPWLGHFAPEYVPEPWLAGPLGLMVLVAWSRLRRGR
jgi:hypothetical protein